MELGQLRAFVVVAEELSFSRAAARLHMTQPPLSQQIKRLERELGVELLHRTTRSVRLTAAGEVYLREVRGALSTLRAAAPAARRAAAGESGTVRLGFSGPTSYRELLAITRAFRTRRPDVRLDILGPFYGGELAERIRLDELDVGLLRLPATDPHLEVRELLRHALVAAVPVDHPLAGRDRISLDDLRGLPFVGYPTGRGSVVQHLIRSAFERRGVLLEPVHQAPDTHTLLALVGAGAGVGLVPEPAAHLGVPGVILVPVTDAPAVPLGLAWRRDDAGPAVAALVELVETLELVETVEPVKPPGERIAGAPGDPTPAPAPGSE